MASRFWVLGTGTWDNSDTTHWAATSGGAGGQSVPGSGDTVTFNASSGGGTVTPNYDMSISTLDMGTFTGTLDFSANNNSPTIGLISCSGTGARTLKMGSGTWTLTGTGTVWTTASSSNLTLDAGTSTIDCTNSSGTSRTVTCNSVPINHLKISAGTGTVTLTNVFCNNLDWTGFTGSWANGTNNVSGNLTLGAGMTSTSGSSTITLSATSSKTITSNSVQIGRPVTLNGVGGTWVLQDDLTMGSTRTLMLTNGTLNANNQDLTIGKFSSSNSNIRAILMGTGTWELIGTGTVWNTSTTINLTLTASTSTIKISDASASDKFFIGGATFNNLWLTGAGTGAFEVDSSNTFNEIRIDTPPHTVRFETDYTQTLLTPPVLSGASGNLMTLKGTFDGLPWYLSKATGTVQLDYLSLQDSHAIGGATWNAGGNSIDISNNEGWNFYGFVPKPIGTNYTNIAKPTGTPYTNLNTQGKEQYDQASLTYDDASVYYDGVNQGAYTNISKP